MHKLWDYNVGKMRSRLEALRDRYFRSVDACPEGHLGHHGDCETHRAMDVYKYAPCTCGLLHDLKIISYDMAVKLFPKMEEDQAKQDAMIPGHRYWRGPMTEDERKSATNSCCNISANRCPLRQRSGKKLPNGTGR